MANSPGGIPLIETSEERARKEQAEENRRASKHRTLQLYFNAALTVATIVTAGIVLYQNRVLSDSLGEMKTQNKTMADTLGEMQKQTQPMINAAQAASDAVTEAVESRKQAAKALDASIESSRLDQRAWVGPTSFALPQCVANGRPVLIAAGCNPQFGANITNSGKTIARKFICIQRAVKAGREFEPLYEDILRPSVATLQPATTVTYSSERFSDPFTAAEVAAVERERLKVYFYGKISYEDIFGVEHFTTFCASVSRDLSSFDICHTYNDAN